MHWEDVLMYNMCVWVCVIFSGFLWFKSTWKGASKAKLFELHAFTEALATQNWHSYKKIPLYGCKIVSFLHNYNLMLCCICSYWCACWPWARGRRTLWRSGSRRREVSPQDCREDTTPPHTTCRTAGQSLTISSQE